MPTSIVVLSQSESASKAAVSYATLLARAMAVPVCLLQMAAGPVLAGESTPGMADDIARPAATLEETIVPTLANKDALLVVMTVPATSSPSAGLADPAVWSLLPAISPPLLLVPSGLTSQEPPSHIALVTDGDPFTLMHGQRAMHALLLTLPVLITVLHTPTARSTSSPADALQTLLTCGLAARYLTTAAALVVPGGNAADKILSGVPDRVRELRADLLVLIIRRGALREAGFGRSMMAALLQQSPVPILLLLAAEQAG
ncbi:adenine nucleotide alpha hydrolase family protein [Hymenobacter lapidiphilus]|uniref:Universal stress protein n=1 Tax=Hymenobacter lapidiphilus TaxID=2608003 RepID=A0A7Y7U6J1_9BACT|nr:hypothetical protein [Hymenobacter lapidiphilus]NVO32578.1 hypothetical protein [Hymenobacter lapidiphilus]